MTWWALVAVAVGTYALKAAGPVAFSNFRIGPRLTRLFTLVAVALLAALVAAITSGAAVTIDPRLAGLAAATVGVALRAPFVVVVASAALVAALLRALAVG